MRRLAWSVLLLGLVAGCGYRPEGSAPSDAGSVPRLYLELVRNQTNRAFIENILSNRLVERFGRSSRFRITEARNEAELLLSVDVTAYSSAAVAYDRTDRIQLYRSSLTLVGTLTRNSDGRILWKGTVNESAEYAANNDDRSIQQANESLAIGRLAELLADDLYARAVDDF